MNLEALLRNPDEKDVYLEKEEKTKKWKKLGCEFPLSISFPTTGHTELSVKMTAVHL